MKTILVMYLYFSSQGEKAIYCEMIGRGYDFQVPGFGYDRFVILDCGPGMHNAQLIPSKIDPEIVITLGSRALPLGSQIDKQIAQNIYKNTKVSKKTTDK